MYSELTLGVSDHLWALHTKTHMACVSHTLQCAAVTLGRKGACPSTNFVRKLFTSLVAAVQNVDASTWDQAIDDFAWIDAHSSNIARSFHYEVSDQIDGGVIKKSLRAFMSVMK